ncbi:hypothetical protein LTR22_017546 [Elasticomyces elasticus]|nr:hypothetical protein LTR22_017546 [Elasticomyces elasticus]KAK4924324.1 hypothetical protein LTR49_008625 [Elasticomyces elasticus]
MPEPLSHLTPVPASNSITTRGHAFWRGDERFFVKGITYSPRNRDLTQAGRGAAVDALSPENFSELQEDIAVVRDLGMNSIFIYYLDPTKDHSKAINWLEEQGIYVMVSIFTNLQVPPARPKNMSSFKAHSDTWPQYSRVLVEENLRIVHEFASYPNLLGFVVSGHTVRSRANTGMAEVLRAAVRDTKAFIQARGGRHIPVGLSANDIRELMMKMIKYFSAGSPAERADFHANECYSWAGPSNFWMSGWSNMVEVIEKTPRIPMLLAEYGANVRSPRVWDEVLCLYSPEMTGVYSGGFVYTLIHGQNDYGIIRTGSDGEKKIEREEFTNLQKSLSIVNARRSEDIIGTDEGPLPQGSEVASEEVKPYEQWVGEFPKCDESWKATEEIPPFPGYWQQVVSEIIGKEQSEVASP